MSSLTADRLYSLLPAVYRLRDDEQGRPLRALIEALAGEFAALEENLAQLYDDQFIETCASWLTPYIGDLIGYRALHGAAGFSSPRAEVANTIRYRRRKGTALMLEQLAADVTGWSAHAVEYFEQLATTQYMKHPRLHARATANLRDERAMLLRGGAFNGVAHTAEMRRAESGGRYNVANVGIFLWRLAPRRLAVPLTPDAADTSGRKFRLNPLGADTPLFRRPRTETDISHLAEPANVPERLSVRRLAMEFRAAQTGPAGSRVDDYGEGRSIELSRAGTATAIPIEDIRICDLRDIVDAGGNVVAWNHEGEVAPGAVGIDPERGRILLGDAADGAVVATFHYGSAHAIGGGDYARTLSRDDLSQQRSVAGGIPLQGDLDEIAGGGRLLIEDSLTYRETPILRVEDVTASTPGAHQVVFAAKNGMRPLVAASGDITLDIGARGSLVIEGVVFSGGTLRLAAASDNEPRELILRDCTLVPGLLLNADGTATSPGAPSLIVEHPFATVTIDRCITGPLMVHADASVALTDCIVDAGAAENVAYAASAAGGPGGELRISASTVVGKVHARVIELASNSILFARLALAPGETWAAPVIAQRRQQGCIRFSYVPPGSIVPRRYHCVPDAAHADVIPHFSSLRYGDPAYGQLRQVTDNSIRRGAEDDREMGVLFALSLPLRETDLRIRLEEYLRYGLRAGVHFAS